MDHHKYSASGAYRWVACPGSIKLSEQCPPQPESKYAKEGTDAHTCLSTMLAAHLKGQRLSTVKALLRNTYPARMVRHAEEAMERALARLTPGAIFLSDIRVEVPYVGFGTLDIAIVEEYGTLTVIDYKYGAGVPVEVENNLQCLYYGVGIAHEYKWAFEDINLVIDQPRAYHKGGPVREWKTSLGELMLAHQALIEGVKACEKIKAKLRAGKHCLFCPAKGICPEIDNMRLRNAQDDFNDVQP